MNRILFISLISLLSAHLLSAAWIVENGKANADIVIAEAPPRAVKLAASELQSYIEKISGATLPIVHAPSEAAVHLFVGRSARAPEVEAPTSDDEAYRIVSGDNWLALIGHDEDFVPTEPWSRTSSEWDQHKRAEWDELTGSAWRNPLAMKTHRFYHEGLDLWRYDVTGSLNAVYGFLRSLGVRWYMPGELGEIVPQQVSIALPEIDQTVQPAFALRELNFDRYHSAPVDDILWAQRLGANRVFTIAHHGIRYITEREEMKQAHPEYYALQADGRRQSGKTANACLSSPGLFNEIVSFCRTILDLYDGPFVSVMPADGFTQICQCDQCKGQATFDRESSGWYSDYVWNFVNRVAEEVSKTHPDKYVVCGAYSTYRLPPLSIDKLHPNVMVRITNGRPRFTLDDQAHKELDDLRRAWLEKSHHKLTLSMNQFTRGGRPGFLPHVMARGVQDAADEVWAEDIWVSERRGLADPGVNHLTPYVISQFWWNPDGDIDALLSEYYRDFYGPAAAEMQAFIEYNEAHYEALTSDQEAINGLFERFAAAKAKVTAESPYGQRIALIDTYLDDLRNRQQQLNVGRGDVPEFRAYNFSNPKYDAIKKDGFTIDGKLDEPFWAMRRPFKPLYDGQTITQPTRFGVLVGRDAVYFGIHCTDTGEQTANIATTEDDVPAIWAGDVIEILIETDQHSYYQLAINPAGAMIDLDRGADKKDWYNWSSKAEVGAHVGEDFWSLEVRIPYTESSDDPLHLVVGNRPTRDLPWFFNICRKHARGDDVELSAFSPTGERSFHNVLMFGKLWAK